MKMIEKLERRIHLCECVHLALLTLLLAFPLTLTFQSDDLSTQILLAFGTVIPVQLIRFLCERIERKPLRLLSGLAVIGLSILLTWSKQRWSVYLLCCIPILVSGVFLPRSKGRILLTVPSPWALLALLTAYGYGRAVESFGVPLIANITLVLTALMVLNFFIHTSQWKLLKDISMADDTEISLPGMIRQNRITLILFLLIGALILTAIPFLLRKEEPVEAAPLPTMEAGETIQVVIENGTGRNYSGSAEGKPLHLELYKDILTWILILIPSVGVIISTVYAVRLLLDMLNRKKKQPVPKNSDGLTIDRLDEEETRRKKEKLTGWEKKIRRRYEKLIRSRAPREARLSALTPTELERAASLDGPGAETVHEIYSLTRYSGQNPTRESYTSFKEAVKNLNPVQTTDKRLQS